MFKEKRIQLLNIFLINCVVILLILPYRVWAYIDPNTGGFFFTSVLPFVYGILAALVIFGKRIVNAVRNIFSRKNKNNGS